MINLKLPLIIFFNIKNLLLNIKNYIQLCLYARAKIFNFPENFIEVDVDPRAKISPMFFKRNPTYYFKFTLLFYFILSIF